MTLAELLSDPKMSPRRFASYFEDFAYVFFPEVEPPRVFLESRRGDCDDFAVLAGYVLTQSGKHETRLIHVRMVGRIAHAVCYVTESMVYLDFNNRRFALSLERCGQTLREIAIAVAGTCRRRRP